ncbi:glycoside hydrolase family 15 protein [Risungbinella massiliensis]|uniref:glycoside hydrolase family 15 protein n=1 Tax=Risungbinella massiliensis TaxID=1329796 RepID=UPI0005CBF385|nr:glycoside hydrolase family 15 protein [Risungbinella massiliensis]
MKRSPVTNKPYLNEAVIGNSSMLIALGSTGEIYRMWWPNIDMPQHVESWKSGIRLTNGSETSWIEEREDWTHHQSYVAKTNILQTTATYRNQEELPLTVVNTDWVLPNKDVLLRHYQFTNSSTSKLEIEFFVCASLTVAEGRHYHTVSFEPDIDGLVYFRQNYAFTLSSANVCKGYTTGNVFAQVATGHLNGNSIAMESEGALSYRIQIPAKSTVDFPIYLASGHTIQEAKQNLVETKELSVTSLFEETKEYWTAYLEKTISLQHLDQQAIQIYERSLLVFALMSDRKTGTVIAAPEFDEAFVECGGYAYCWGRDAAFIATAFDQAGLTHLSRSFYQWALTAQDADGSWQQRHYHDGTLAPSWGLQIDEGASLIWGMYQHYLNTSDPAFLHEIWEAVKKGTEFLVEFLDPQTGLPLPSNDLWEERFAEHTYSAAAVYGGISAAAEIAKVMGIEEYATKWSAVAIVLKKAIEDKVFDPKTNRFYRGLKLSVNQQVYEDALQAGRKGYIDQDQKGYQRYVLEIDPILDISLVGLSIPFGILSADDERMVATANAIEETCTSPVVGGIRRYENDDYIGGNPWILTTLWLAQLRIKQGRMEDATRLFQWAIDHASPLGLLPEQVDQQTGEPAWVLPLTWSHAMFVLTAHLFETEYRSNRKTLGE